MGFHCRLTRYNLISLLGLLVGVTLHIVAIATDYWLSGSFGHSGLWIKAYDVLKPDFIYAVRTFVFVALFCALAALVMCSLNICVEKYHKHRVVMVLGILGCFAAGIAVLIAIAVFVSKSKSSKSLHWSFGLEVVCAALFFLSGGFFVMERKSYQRI